MAGKWEGFTEEDIGHYLHNHDDANNAGNVVPKRQASNLQGAKKKNVTRERMLTNNRKPDSDNSTEIAGNLPAAARLSKEVQEADALIPLVPQDTANGTSDGTQSSAQGVQGTAVEGCEAEQKISDVSAATLEVFQARQKMLEEQNRRRKEMLARMLSDRKKQTSAEAKRLQNIQDELQKIDLLLSTDVGILRDQIEVASLDFAEAQKRYNKAEKDFLEAKQSLFSKLEKKELLTRHLCTIIEESEMRKAHKLSELMEKLSIGEQHVQTTEAIQSVIKSPYYESALTDLKDSKTSPTPTPTPTPVNPGCENKESPST